MSVRLTGTDYSTQVYVPTKFLWNPEEPVTVALVFSTSSGAVEWKVSRDTLREGCSRAVNNGMFEMRAYADGTRHGFVLRLSGVDDRDNPHTAEIWYMDNGELLRFLHNTYRQIPADREEAFIIEALDKELTELLKEA
jgi:hypothetical protein